MKQPYQAREGTFVQSVLSEYFSSEGISLVTARIEKGM
jgi:hypothetical protein